MLLFIGHLVGEEIHLIHQLLHARFYHEVTQYVLLGAGWHV